MRMRFYLFSVLFFFRASAGAIGAPADSTLSLTCSAAEKIFLEKNLLLIAEQYHVDAAKAQVIQARLFNNPTLYTEGNAYNKQKGKAFDIGSNGEKIFSVTQLIQTAGKRNKSIELARQNALLTEAGFNDLLRTLKLQLRSSFFGVHYLNNSIRLYDQQITTLKQTLVSFEEQYNRGNIPLKELLRLKALAFELSTDKNELMGQLAENQKNLRLFLHTTATIVPIVESRDITRYTQYIPDETKLVSTALQARPDLKMQETTTRMAELNYSLQKAQAYPDIRIGGVYDQAASYTPNYMGLSVGFDLPLLNRNQGNIKAAHYMLDYSRTQQENKKLEVEQEVKAVLSRIRNLSSMATDFDTTFSMQFETLSKGLLENFQRRNISLIEFIDLYESYITSATELNALYLKRISAYEELSYTVGIELYP